MARSNATKPKKTEEGITPRRSLGDRNPTQDQDEVFIVEAVDATITLVIQRNREALKELEKY